MKRCRDNGCEAREKRATGAKLGKTRVSQVAFKSRYFFCTSLKQRPFSDWLEFVELSNFKSKLIINFHIHFLTNETHHTVIYVVPQEYEHAVSRGAKIYAELVGYGLSGMGYFSVVKPFCLYK